MLESKTKCNSSNISQGSDWGADICSSSEFAAEILEIKKSKDPGRETGLQATIENNLIMCFVLAGLRQERKAQSFVETSDTCMP